MREDGIPHFPMLMKSLVLKGDFKMLVLGVLQNRPMHGYEITTYIQEKSNGMYRPSPGAVYPTLQALLKKGMVEVTKQDRRKVYRITPAGKRFLKDKHAEIHKCIESLKQSMGPERALVIDEMAKTGKILAIASKTITPDQAKKIAKILNESRERILRILAE